MYNIRRQDFYWFCHLAPGLHIDIVVSVEAQEDSVLVTRGPRGLFIHLHGNLESVEVKAEGLKSLISVYLNPMFELIEAHESCQLNLVISVLVTGDNVVRAEGQCQGVGLDTSPWQRFPVAKLHPASEGVVAGLVICNGLRHVAGDHLCQWSIPVPNCWLDGIILNVDLRRSVRSNMGSNGGIRINSCRCSSNSSSNSSSSSSSSNTSRRYIMDELEDAVAVCCEYKEQDKIHTLDHSSNCQYLSHLDSFVMCNLSILYLFPLNNYSVKSVKRYCFTQ